MSYDLYLEIDTGGDCFAIVAEIGNYTSNVSGMWFKALGESLSHFDGRNAGESVPQLDKAIQIMRDLPDVYRAMNPDNDWGRYEGALGYLEKLRAGCAQHPKTTIRVSC